jgi:RNA polymerase sigma-70 factor (ECF subfamily)
LIARARAGDREAIGALLVRWQRELRAYVVQRAGGEVLGRESGIDIVQSACAEVIEDLPGAPVADGEAGLKAWLFQATVRKIIDRQRYWHRAKRDVRREAVRLDSTQAGWLESLTALRDALPSPSTAAVQSEELAKIAAALDQLPEQQRQVIQLIYFERLPQAEVAERIGRSEDAVRGLVARAVARLARLVLRGTA